MSEAIGEEEKKVFDKFIDFEKLRESMKTHKLSFYEAFKKVDKTITKLIEGEGERLISDSTHPLYLQMAMGRAHFTAEA
eukprot:scaffold1858_cov101-Cylindrotheca_fusiformis.AAC.2